MSQKTYRAAAIGHTGAGNYGHGLHVAYKNLENVEFIAVADPDDAGRKKAVEETGAIRDYPGLSRHARQRGIGYRKRLPALDSRAPRNGARLP